MPRPYPDRRGLQRAVLARVAAGETVKAVGLEAGMPSQDLVSVWARADPVFRAELDDALRRGAWRRLYAFDEAKAAAFLARVRAGEAVNDVVGQPGMPGRKTYRYWKATQASFAEAMGAIRQRRDTHLGLRARDRLWRAWDPAVADRIVARLWMGTPLRDLKAADPDLPGVEIVRRWRREQPGFGRAVDFVLAAWARKRPGWQADRRCTPALSEAIREKLVMGGSFRSIGAEPGMPSATRMGRWMRTEPAFAAMVREACVDREDWYREHIDVVESEMAPGMTVAELKAIRARSAPWRVQLGRLKTRPGSPPARG